MQFLQDNFFYHSDSRLGAGGGLEKERQLLVEEQKLSRARARKFSVETNRRRKALEERQKQWDKQEQRLRENVLQQRRQRVQDATERFQRAHLPPSQRRRQSIRRNVPNIDDALNHIQGNLQQSSFLSSSSSIYRSCTPSPKPPTVSRHAHKALSAVEAYTKLLEEQNMTCSNDGQQTEKTPEKQQDPSPQDGRLSDCCYSESISSKDSLENEDPNHSTDNLQSSYSSFVLDSEKSNQEKDSFKQKDSFPTSDLTPFFSMMLLGDNTPQTRKLSEPRPGKQEEDSDNNMLASKASWGFTSTPKTESRPALLNPDLLALSEIMSADRERFRINFPQNSPNENIITISKTPPDDTALRSLCPQQEALKNPAATETLLPAKNNVLLEDPTQPNISLHYSRTERDLLQTHKENPALSSKIEASASINNLNKVSNLEPKTEKSINTALLLLPPTGLSNIQSDTLKCLKCSEEGATDPPAPAGTSPSVRLIKGILKKPSRCMSGDTTCTYGSGHLIFAQQVAQAIRDSVELARAKSNYAERNGGVKKKLRWFDEVNEGKEEKKADLFKQTNTKSPNGPESKNPSEDHQLSPASVSGASRLGPSVTPSALTSYHFTKQAWTDVGVQVSLPHKRADEVKAPRSSTRTGGPKVPRRERCARTVTGPVSSRARKGTVIRPQSATGVCQIAKTQGKMMIPRPPPRMQSPEREEKPPYITKSPYYGVDHGSVNSKQTLAVEQALYRDTSEGFSSSPYTHHVIQTDSTVMYTPLQPSYTSPVSEVNAKGAPGSGHQDTQGCSRRRGTVYNEKGLCLDCTPTDDEISQLWYGVRSALASKDAKNMLSRPVPESEKGARKPCAEPSRQPPVSGNRKFPQPSQPAKQTAGPTRSRTSTHNVAFPGLDAEGRLEDRSTVAAMETVQTLRPGTVQQRSQQGLTNISLEEQRLLLSLDRLNHQLYCVRDHGGPTIGMQGLVLIGAPSTKEVRVTNHHRRRSSSANNRSRHQKKS